MTETDIIKACKAQDRAVHEFLYKKYYGIFLKICMRYAGNNEDAEQWMNDGFYKIFTKINRYNATGSFEGWMKRVVVNTCLDNLKLASVKRQLLNTAIDDVNNERYGISNAGNDGLHNISFKELIAVIQGLPSIHKIIFNLYVFDGYNHKEIAAELGIKEGTSAWYLNKARTKLQQELLLHYPKSVRDDK